MVFRTQILYKNIDNRFEMPRVLLLKLCFFDESFDSLQFQTVLDCFCSFFSTLHIDKPSVQGLITMNVQVRQSLKFKKRKISCKF